jgi:hypothetical protein
MRFDVGFARSVKRKQKRRPASRSRWVNAAVSALAYPRPRNSGGVDGADADPVRREAAVARERDRLAVFPAHEAAVRVPLSAVDELLARLGVGRVCRERFGGERVHPAARELPVRRLVRPHAAGNALGRFDPVDAEDPLRELEAASRSRGRLPRGGELRHTLLRADDARQRRELLVHGRDDRRDRSLVVELGEDQVVRGRAEDNPADVLPVLDDGEVRILTVELRVVPQLRGKPEDQVVLGLSLLQERHRPLDEGVDLVVARHTHGDILPVAAG